MEDIQVDLTGYAVPVPQGTESLIVEWSSGDHSSGGALPPHTHGDKRNGKKSPKSCMDQILSHVLITIV